MKKIFSLLIFSIFIFSGCDYWGSYTFNVKNETQDTITLKFVNELSQDNQNPNEIVLLPTEEKTVITIGAPLNSPAHDCLNEHGMAFFTELVFDTYVNGEKLEKQLWQPENWTYHYKSKYSAEYSMTITEEMIEK